MSAPSKVMTFRTLVRTIIIVAAFPLIPMLISGHWDWWEAWVDALVSILGFIISRVLAARQHPDLLEERAHSMELQDAKPWDKLLAPILAFGALFILIVARLDTRFDWTLPFTKMSK